MGLNILHVGTADGMSHRVTIVATTMPTLSLVSSLTNLDCSLSSPHTRPHSLYSYFDTRALFLYWSVELHNLSSE